MQKHRRCWAKCLRCGRRQMPLRRELVSRRGARCTDCGGPLEVSSDQADRTAASRDAMTADAVRTRQQTEAPQPHLPETNDG